MGRINIILIFLILLFSGCSTSKRVFQNEQIFDFNKFNLGYAIDLEEKLESEDISPNYRVKLGKGIYPNKNNYELEISTNYRRTIKPYFSLEVDYHYTRDSLIRVVMYEWNEFNKPSYRIAKEDLKMKKIFSKKFIKLRSKLTKKFGAPSYINITPDNSVDMKTYRNGIKWLDKDGMNIYLFAFVNPKGTYNQIRLAFYPN